MAGSFKEFYKTYSTYLGGDEEKLLKLIVLERPAESLRRCVRLVQKAISEGRDSGE